MDKNQQKIDKNFVSDIDKRLVKFDKTHPKSASQLAEITKYKRIYELRDNPNAKKSAQDKDIWE